MTSTKPTTKAEQANFKRVRDARLPAAREASRTLQTSFGIPHGTKIIGDTTARLWEMPVPPTETLEQRLAGLKEAMIQAAQETKRDIERNKERNRQFAEWNEMSMAYGRVPDSIPYPSITSVLGSDVQSAELQRGSIQDGQMGQMYSSSQNDKFGWLSENEEPQCINPRLLIREPSADEDWRDSPDAAATLSDHDDTPRPGCTGREIEDLTLTPTKYTAFRQATPPPDWQPDPRSPGFNSMPAYWSHHLSKHLNRWLAQSETKSAQIMLGELELRGPVDQSSSHVYLSMHAKDYHKIKLVRLRLPPLPPEAADATRPRHWFVVQVDYSDIPKVSKHEAENIVPLSKGELPWWLLAFPIQAITASKVEKTPDLESPTPMRARPQMRRASKKPRIENWIHTTTFVLGVKGRSPVVHGRGINPKSVKGFLEACANGQGVVEAKSVEPVPLSPW